MSLPEPDIQPSDPKSDLPSRIIPEAYRVENVLPKWLQGEPTLIISLTYALLTVAGAMHAGLFYHKLGLDFLALADITDFLVIIFRKPLLPLLLLLPLPAYLLYMWGVYGLMKFAARYSTLAKRLFLKAHVPPEHNFAPLMVIVFMLCWAFAFVTFYTVNRIDHIRSDEVKKVTVHYAQSELRKGDTESETAVLAGTTVRFVILYDQEKRQCRAIPHDAIHSIEFPPRKKKNKDSGKSAVPPPSKPLS